MLGLANAPKIVQNKGINIKDLDYLVMPYDSLGSIPVFEALKNNIPVYAVKENCTELNITKDKILKTTDIIEISTYDNVLKHILER